MDPEVKKQVLREITYGLYVVTAAHGDETAGAAVTWLSQASFSPPLVMVSIKTDSHLHAVVEKAGRFAASIVPEDKRDLATAFFRGATVEDGRINGYEFEAGPSTGAPLPLDLPAWFEARVTDVVRRGDHTVFVAEVVEAGVRDGEAKPLVLAEAGWSYGG